MTDTTTTQPQPWSSAEDAAYGPPPPYSSGDPIRSREPNRRRRLFFPAALALTALLGGAAGAGVAIAFDDDPVATGSPGGSGASTIVAESTARTDVGAVAQKASPSVVTISVAGLTGNGTGSGVIISEDGYVVTNNHVVAGAGADISVRLHDGREMAATVVGTDPTSDLAVIQLQDVSDLTPIEWGDSSSLEVGDVVVAIGSPLGLDGTLTSGVVSTISRPVRTGDAAGSEAVIDAIQHDAPINPGNSGGALLDSQGRLVGINSAIATAGEQQSGNIGVGFAIPSDTVRNVAEQIIDQGYADRAYLGVSTSTAGAPLGQSTAGDGAQVREVVAGGPAQAAGLQVGDIITGVGERQIEDADELTVAIRNNAPGDTVEVTYQRGGAENTVSVTLGTAPRA